MQINVNEAKTNLSELMKKLESGEEKEIVIARYGKPVIRMVPFVAKPAQNRIGIAQGKINCPDDIDFCNDEIADLFGMNDVVIEGNAV